MKTRVPYMYAIGLMCLSFSALYGQYGDIPASRMAPSGWQNIQYSDPGGWTTINVTQNGLPANDSSIDAGQKIEQIIASTSGRRKLYFPAGTYTFKTTADINVGDIWIDGDGMDTTIFNLDFPKFQKRDGIAIKGGTQGTTVDIVGTPNRGDSQITVTNASQFQVGDYVRVKYPYTASDGDVVDVGQIVKVTAKAGTTLTIDLKIGVDFGSGGTVREMDFAENVRVTDLTINRLRLGDRWEDNLRLTNCRNFQVKNVESIKSTTYGIRAFQCRDGIISECEVHERWGNEGGYAYGIAATALSTRIHITNNYLYNLRHHIELAKSPNHCVISYNETGPLHAYSDIGAHHGDESHNNLFEGNDGRQIVMALDAHAKAWWNTFYRNKASNTVGSQSSQFETTTIVGNETPGISFAGSNNYKGSNIVNGVFQAGSLPAGSNLPPSLYLSSQPSYVPSWPLFGPGTGGGSPGGATTYQAENLSRTSGGATTSLNGSGTWVNLNADSTNDWVEFTLPNVSAGTYSVSVNIQKFGNGGQAQTSIGGTNQGGVIDFYTGGGSADPFSLGNKTFSATGNKTIRFTVTGKNGSSTGYKLAIDSITLTPVASGSTFEAENLSRTSGGATTSLNGSGTWVNLNANSTNDWVQFTLPNVAAGTYTIKVNIQKFNNGGIAQTSVGGSNLGGTHNWYSGSSTADPFTVGTTTFGTTGNKTIRFTVTGKDGASSGYKLAIDKIILE